MSVRRFLDLSTGHLKPETRDRLDAGWEPTSNIMSGEYGWMIYTQTVGTVLYKPFGKREGEYDPKLVAQLRSQLGDDLVDCMAKAQSLGCDYILFDRDGPRRSELGWYEDEPVLEAVSV